MSAEDYSRSNTLSFPQFFTTGQGLRREAHTLYSVFLKRIFDIVLSLLLLPFLAPFIAIIWMIAKIDGGPGFFGHSRIGQNGRVFKCWKIRTMVPDAEARLVAYLDSNPEAAAEWERDCKLDNDPRITKIGAFLRTTSLDELPQIWNVFKGDMSFVGPRPVTRSELQKYGQYSVSYISLRPGITGIWQVSGRNEVKYPDRVRMDVRYRYSLSLLLDIEIILKTAWVVLRQTGK